MCRAEATTCSTRCRSDGRCEGPGAVVLSGAFFLRARSASARSRRLRASSSRASSASCSKRVRLGDGSFFFGGRRFLRRTPYAYASDPRAVPVLLAGSADGSVRLLGARSLSRGAGGVAGGGGWFPLS